MVATAPLALQGRSSMQRPARVPHAGGVLGVPPLRLESHQGTGKVDQRQVGEKFLELSDGQRRKPCPAWLECLQPR